MSQAVSSRPLTAEDLVRAPISPLGICGEQSGLAKGLSPSSIFPVDIISPWLSMLIYHLENKQ
jgi:hypothetical protein